LTAGLQGGRLNIVLTDRDIRLLALLARVRYITLTQAACLLYGRCDDCIIPLDRARDSLKHRIAQLVNAGYLEKGITRYEDKLNTRAYFLGPAGAKAVQELSLIEQMEVPGWLSRKQNAAWNCSAHDLMVNNFLFNLMLLDRAIPGFQLIDWKTTHDLKYYVRGGDKPLVFDPDLFILFVNEGFGPVPLFLELDNGNISANIARRKVMRVFQYYETGHWRNDLGIEYFPRLAFLVPDENRIVFFKRAISWARRAYRGSSKLQVQRLTFYLATFRKVDLYALDRGEAGDKVLSKCWQTSDVNKSTSPFLK